MRKLGLILGCIALILVITAGCQQSSQPDVETQPVAVLDPSAEFEGLSPAELFTVIRQINDDYDAVARLFSSSGGRHRLTKMRQLVDRAILVAETIETHPEATDEETKAAIGVLLRMHHQGLSMGWDGFELRTNELAERLFATYGNTPESATVAAILLKREFLEGELPDANAAEGAIEAHIIQFPEQPTGPKLYADYARLLLRSGKKDEATRVCRDVIEVFGDVPSVAPLRGVLRTIQIAETQRHREESYYKSRAAEFGGRTDGYFVLFLRPKKLGYMSPVDYVVCHGIKEAVQAADSSPKFELEAWYPDTPNGRQQANIKAEELYQKNTFEMATPR